MQSRDEIAEQVVALAGSVSSEKAAKMRELVRDAREDGYASLSARVAALERKAGEGAPTREGGASLREAARNLPSAGDARGQNIPVESPQATTPSPASSASVPEWVPSANEIASTLWLAAGLGAHHALTERQMLELRRLIASRAPSPYPALAAIVEAGDAMAEKVAKIVNDHRGAYFERGLKSVLAAYDRARAEMPKGWAA